MPDRQVGDAHRRVGLVDVLAAGAGRAVGVDADVGVVHLDVDVLRLRQHRDGGGRGVDTALRLGLRHPLHAVHAALELQPPEDAVAADRGDDLLVAAHLAFALALHLDLPAVGRRVALVHAEEIAGEDRRLVAAGAGAHLEDRRGVLVGVARRQQQGERVLQRRLGLGKLGQLVACELGHLGVVAGAERLQLGALALQRVQPLGGLGDRLQLGVLLGEPHQLGPVAGRAHARLHFLEAGENLFEPGLGKAHGRFSYSVCRN